MFKNTQNGLKITAQIGGAIGVTAYSITMQLSKAQPGNTALSNLMTGVFTASFIIAGVALLGMAISSSDQRADSLSFFHKFKTVLAKAMLYVILPSVVLTAILCALFLRS